MRLCGRRFYDNATGRFLTRDPLGMAGGLNLFAYAGNNPVNLAGPSGLCATDGSGGGELRDNYSRNQVDTQIDTTEQMLIGAALAPLGGVDAEIAGDAVLGAEGAAGADATPTVYLLHETTENRAELIIENGFKADSEGLVFFAEEFATAKGFALMRRSAKQLTVLSLKIPQAVYDTLNFERGTIGSFREATYVDFGGSNGYERVTRSIGALNKAMADGRIKMIPLPIQLPYGNR